MSKLNIGLLTATLSVATIDSSQSAALLGFSQPNAAVNITTTSVLPPQVITAVTVTCPAAGKLVASATAELSYRWTGPVEAYGRVLYGISRNSSSLPTKTYSSAGPANSEFEAISEAISVQRVDSCARGAAVTYRLVAILGLNTGDASMRDPVLIVTFF